MREFWCIAGLEQVWFALLSDIRLIHSVTVMKWSIFILSFYFIVIYVSVCVRVSMCVQVHMSAGTCRGQKRVGSSGVGRAYR